MHELEQLVDHGLEELPVGTQEFGVLSHHVPKGKCQSSQTSFVRWLCTHKRQKLTRLTTRGKLKRLTTRSMATMLLRHGS